MFTALNLQTLFSGQRHVGIPIYSLTGTDAFFKAVDDKLKP